MMRRALWFLLLGSCIGRAAPVAPGPEVVRYPVENYQLSNGLRVVLERSSDSGRAGAVLLVGAGSGDEKPDQAGLAHLVEHLVLETKRDGTQTRMQEWEALGGTFNGMTSWDDTTYFAFVPEQNLGALLKSFAIMTRDPLAGADDDLFSHERQIVTNELRLRDENGAPGQAFGWLASSLFPRWHTYAHPTCGTRESLPKLTLTDARAFAAAHYRPEASTLVVTAPQPVSTLKAVVAQAFGVVPGGRRKPDGSSIDVPAAGQGLKQIDAHEAPVSVPELWIGWSIPDVYGSDSDIPELVADMAEGTFWSNLSERDHDISHVDAGVRWGTRGSLFYLRVKLKEATAPEASARSVIREMLRGLSDRTHQYRSFDAYKRFRATDRTYSEEHPVARALHMAWSEHFRGDPMFVRGRAARMVALAANKVSDYYVKHLDQDLASAVLLRPIEQAHAALVDLPSSNARRVSFSTPPDPKTAQAWLMPLGVGRARRARLDSGLDVIILPRPGSPFHTAVLGYHVGAQGDGTGGVVPAASWAMQSVGPSPALRGVSFAREFRRDAMRFVLRSAGSDVMLSLELLRKAKDGYQISWPPPQFFSQLKLFEQEDQSPSGELIHALTQAIWNSHPYGKQPRPADVRRVTPSQVHRWVSDVIRSDNGVLIIVGDVDADRALAAATREFGGSRSGLQSRPPVAAPPPLERVQAAGSERLIVRHQPGSTQAYLTFACVLPPATQENLMTLRLFKTVLERRLFAELRQNQGASYAVDAGLNVLRGGTSMVELRADIDYAELKEALGEFRGYLDQGSDQILGDAVLAGARAQIASQFNLAHATTLEVARALFASWNQGWALDAADRNLNRIWDTELTEVKLVADHCRDNWVLALRGDEPRIRAAWQAAGSVQPTAP